MVKLILFFILFSFTALAPLNAFAQGVIDPAIYFPAVVQGHHKDDARDCHGIGDKQIEQKEDAKINGTNGEELAFCSVNDDIPKKGCDNGSGGYHRCKSTGSDIRGIALEKFPKNKSKKKIENCDNKPDSEKYEKLVIKDCDLTLPDIGGDYLIKEVILEDEATLTLPAGDYWFEKLEVKEDSEIIPVGDVRIFVKHDMKIEDGEVKKNSMGQTMLIGHQKIEITKESEVYALIYSDKEVILKEEAVVFGRVTTKKLKMEKESKINKLDLDPPQPPFALQFGKARSGSVIFDTPFEPGVTPLIFVMPTITDDDPEDNDGPASVFLTDVSNTGFSWWQVEPEIPLRRWDLDSRPMNEVHWIAITSGQHELSDGTYLEAGTVDVNEPFYKNKGTYKQITMSRNYDVVLNQIQSSKNSCWLTSTAKWHSNSLSVGIDVSEVVDAGPGNGYGNKYCLPDYVKLNKLKTERVAYLALKSGAGKITIDGKDIQYQFGSDFWTSNSWDRVDANQQCSTLRPLVGFSKAPVFVAGKHSRLDNNGGWLRRCQLTKNSVSMVTDEDRYQNSERDHEAEKYGFVALEVIEDIQELVHHFEFDYSSSPLTCNAEAMTIRACRNANCDLFTDPVTATLLAETKASGGWVGGNDVKLVNGSAKVSLRSNTTEPITIGVISSFPSTVAGSDTLCKKGSGLLNTASCTIEFAKSGFILDIPDEFSNKPSKNILVKAVKDGGGQQCIPAFKNERKSLAFWSDYIAPSTGTKNISVKSGSAEEEIGDSDINPKTFLLDFDKDGEAKIDVNYADAGKVQLNARYTGSGDESGLIMGGSDLFVRRPVGICVESEACDNCSVTGNKYKRAGEEFDITVKAMAWQSDSDGDICNENMITPNFTHKNVDFTHELIRPSVDDGGVKGSLGLSEYEQTSGEQTIKQSVSEVGIFTFSVTPKAGGYFGYDIPGATTASMGRFTPYYLTTTPTIPKLHPGCVDFTYIDEPFVFKTGLEPRLLIVGKDKAGNETKNYQIKTEDENWWKYNNQWDERKFSNLAGSPLPTLEDVSPDSSSVAFLDGVSGGSRSAYLQNGTLRYKRTSTPLAPFNALFEFKLSAGDLKDSDGICYQKSATSSCAGVTFEEIAKGDNFVLRYGRLLLDNGYSPQSESLRLPLRTEYVSAVAETTNIPTWVTNGDDRCSVYNTVTSTDTTEAVTTGMNMTSPAGFPVITAHSDSKFLLQSGTVAEGVDQIYFTVPNTSGEVRLKQHVEPWLKWYWNFDGNKPNDLYDPRASAFFGTYRGHDKVIYWHEVN